MENVTERLNGFRFNKGASLEAISKLEKAFGRELPTELRDILLVADGAEGEIGGHELQLWSTEEIIAYNRANEVQRDCPEFVMFASDGGGETYTLDYRTNPPGVALIAAIGFDYDSAIRVGHNFVGFLDRLKDPKSLFEE